jgi:hypothetical protein
VATEAQIQAWKAEINAYKDKYSGMSSGKRLSDKLVKSFCDIYNIPWRLPSADEIPDELDFLR